jgi:hypothetical protein
LRLANKRGREEHEEGEEEERRRRGGGRVELEVKKGIEKRHRVPFKEAIIYILSYECQ